MESAIKRLVRYKGKHINFNQVDKEYLIGFIDYLNHETNDFDSRKVEQGREQKPLSDVYTDVLFARIMVALNKAELEGIIIKNQGKDIDHILKPHAKESTIWYLTLDEVKKIIDTPYAPKNDVKHAFLLCCFSGLRHSDLLQLTWGEIKQTSDGQFQIETMMKKTKHSVSKLLGHCNIRTTQIYAKIVDEQKRKAVNLILKL